MRTSVATLVWQSPKHSENQLRTRRGGQWPPKAPLADQGWCSAQRIQILMTAGGSPTIVYAAPVRTLGLRGSELTYFDNPSVSRLRGMREPAPFAQGSRGCSRTSATQRWPAVTCAVCCCSKKRNDTELVPNGLPIIAQPTHALSAATRRRLSDESPGRTEPGCQGRNESRSPLPHS